MNRKIKFFINCFNHLWDVYSRVCSDKKTAINQQICELLFSNFKASSPFSLVIEAAGEDEVALFAQLNENMER